MQRSNDFSLFTISDVPYLLPFGQGIADLKRGVQINETGAYLWELLDRERTENEILSLYAAHYEIPDSQMPQLKTDLQQFLHMLKNHGMLKQPGNPVFSGAASDSGFGYSAINPPVSVECTDYQTISAFSTEKECADNKNNPFCTNAVQRYLSIGGLTLLLCGPAKAFSRDFDAFEIFPVSGHVSRAGKPASRTSAASQIDQTITITEQAPPPRPESRVLLQNHELIVMENEQTYVFLFPNAPGIREVRLAKDGAHACYYCCPPYTETFQQDIFHAIRLSFLYLAQLHDMVVLHSASLLYQGRAWLFSGHSGAGKSTHTNLWKELYNVPLINGDLNLLSVADGLPMIHGLPWCGTSGIADTHSYPLGGIFLIRKALQNHTTAPDDSHAQLLVTQRLISPAWTEALMRKNLHFVAKLAPHILIRRLHCTKTPEAAETGKQAIDDYLALRPDSDIQT